jgi:hypothetical protein
MKSYRWLQIDGGRFLQNPLGYGKIEGNGPYFAEIFNAGVVR